MAELRELDMVAGDRDELLAQVAALRDKLSDQRDERGQVEHYRQVKGVRIMAATHWDDSVTSERHHLVKRTCNAG